MNILLVSVTERTREIGVRIAIGARRISKRLEGGAIADVASVRFAIAGGGADDLDDQQ